MVRHSLSVEPVMYVITLAYLSLYYCVNIAGRISEAAMGERNIILLGVAEKLI
jgi:hypothetical protein